VVHCMPDRGPGEAENHRHEAAQPHGKRAAQRNLAAMSERLGYTAMALAALALALIFSGLIIYSIGFDVGVIIGKAGVLLGCVLVVGCAAFVAVVCAFGAWHGKD
jgi:hypothetical protein